MLVLVSQLIESCFGKLKHKLASIITVLLLFVPTFCFAQDELTSGEADSSARVSHQEKSVLVLVEGESSNLESPRSGANSSARIDDRYSGNATFTARPVSSSPQPPQDLLIPANPSEAEFTRPLVNELHSESLSSLENRSTNDEGPSRTKFENDGEKAIGTFATTNQSFQDQASGFGSRFAPPGNSSGQFSSQAPSIPQSAPPVSAQPEGRPNSSGGIRQFDANQSSRAPLQQAAPNVRSFNALNNLAGQQQTPSSSGQIPDSYNAQAYGQLGNRDSNVRPTGFDRPVSPPIMTTNLAKLLIERYSADSYSEALPGQPTKLIEMLRQPIATQQRRPMVHQYWETYYDWANYVSAKDYEQWLNRVPDSVSQADNAILKTNRAVARNNSLSAEIQLGKSQSGLLQYMPNWSSTELLPLPNDLPLIQKYKTNYELYRSRQLMPVSLRGIDEMLPKTLDLIILRAEAVKIAKTSADQVLTAMSSGQSNMIAVLEAGRIWRATERDLVASVVGYNQAIGDYSMSVTGGYQAPEDVVAMLIAKPQVSVAQAPANQASSVLQRQPAQFNSNSQGRAQYDTSGQSQPRQQPQSVDQGFGNQPPRQNPGNGSGGTSSFNLNSNGARRFNQGSAPNGAAGTSGPGSFSPPASAPQRQSGNTSSQFGPLVPQ